MTDAKNTEPTASGSRPLAGRRILITRAPHQASELADGLRRLGATVILIPTIELAPPSSFAALDAAIASLCEFDWIAFTSANAVYAFAERGGAAKVSPGLTRIAAVGPATARAVESFGLHVDLKPTTYTAESLGNALLSEVHGRRVLLVLAEEAPTELAESLTAGGAWVQVAPAYRNRIPQNSPAEIAALFSDADLIPHAVTFTSASTARNLAALLQSVAITLPASVARISIGPVTSKALEELNLPPHAEAAEATIEALLDALRQYLG